MKDIRKFPEERSSWAWPNDDYTHLRARLAWLGAGVSIRLQHFAAFWMGSLGYTRAESSNQ
jgi:hypothetical protein